MLRQRNHFAYAVVSHACTIDYSGISVPLHFLDFTFILRPLQEFLSKPAPLSILLQELEVLAIRFQRLYHNIDADLSRVFSVDMTFLTLVREQSLVLLARSRTYYDLEHFRKLCLTGIIKQDEHTRSLNARWNSLCRAVEECAAADELRPRLVELAEVRDGG